VERSDALFVAVTVTIDPRSPVATVLVDTGSMSMTVPSFPVQPQQKVTPITDIHTYSGDNALRRCFSRSDSSCATTTKTMTSFNDQCKFLKNKYGERANK